MTRKQCIHAVLLSFIALNFLLTGVSYSSEDKVVSKVKDGYRILDILADKGIQNFTVYRGDYIKFNLPKGSGQTLAVFPSLNESKQITEDLETSAYFKMKQEGVYPFHIGSVKGQIKVIEYQQASYRELTSSEADEFIRTDNPLILDVRTQREYTMGHLENAMLIPVQELQSRINELEDHKNSEILVYCATGNRSTVASKIFIDAGFNKIFNLRHGIADWAKNKYPIVK